MIEKKLTRQIREKLNKVAFRRITGWLSPTREEYELERDRVYNIFVILMKNGIAQDEAFEAIEAQISVCVNKYRDLKRQMEKIQALT